MIEAEQPTVTAAAAMADKNNGTGQSSVPKVATSLLSSTVKFTNAPISVNDKANASSISSYNCITIDDSSSSNDEDQKESSQNKTAHQNLDDLSDAKSAPNPNLENETNFEYGPYVPIIRKDDNILIDHNGIVDYYSETNLSAQSKRLICEVLPDDAILEAPSLVTPLLLKKKTKWPPKQVPSELECESTGDDANANISQVSDDGIQVIKVVDKSERAAPVIDANNKTVNDYIKSATVASLANSKFRADTSILTVEDYYKSSVGEMLLGIGLSRAGEYNLEYNVRKLAHKIKKGGDCANLTLELESMRKDLGQARISNEAYKSDQVIKCPHCSFTSQFSSIIDGHLEAPHMNSKRELMCNFCDFKTKDSNQIVFHFLIEHKRRCRIEKPVASFNCPFCPYECRSRKKLTLHIERCEKIFPHGIFQGPQDYGENDFPAITSKWITQEDVKTYEQTLKDLRLSAYDPHQLKVSGSNQQGGRQPVVVVPKKPRALPSNAVPVINMSNFDPFAPRVNPNVASCSVPLGQNPFGLSSDWMVNNQPINTVQPSQNLNSAQLLYLLSAQNAQTNQFVSGTLQHPTAQSPFMNGRSVMRTVSGIIMSPQSQQSASNGVDTDKDLNRCKDSRRVQHPEDGAYSGSLTPNSKSSTFVICEICDCYIKDLNQFKHHMQWTHKVKIHRKTLESRPPLNCQRCSWRFFTDQGLERHLLGAHGLVTSNMQEQADQGTDSGRCTVCGRVYASKLVPHMREAHKTNLKPAHLSYKCTVCSATFNLYRLFENHVYSVHSESVRT